MNGLVDYQAAGVGFMVALLLVVLITPAVSLAAWHFGVLDVPTDARRLHRRPIPRLGGVAIYIGIVIPALALGHHHGFWGIMLGATLMLGLGLLDDIHSLHPGVKMAGLVAIAAVPVSFGIRIDHVTLPLLGVFNLGWWSVLVTVLWVVAIANIVNFIDGMDGLAAGFCAIAALTFAILSASLSHPDAAAISAIVAGASVGFLRYNFHPASIIMGDCGALMLGYLLATIAIQGVLKTAAAVSLVFPLVVLALPILDTLVRDPQADEVRAADLPSRSVAFPSPVCLDRVWSAAHRVDAVRLVLGAFGLRAGHPVRAQSSHWMGHHLGVGAGQSGLARRGHVPVRDLHARDPETSPSPGRRPLSRGVRRRDTKTPCGVNSR